MRGLKQHVAVLGKRIAVVASFTGAWIETAIETETSLSRLVASFTGAWIETYIALRDNINERRRILYGCVD